MAKLDQIEELSGNLQAVTTAALPKRCSRVRNWNSKCRACIDACKHDAIRSSIGRLHIDFNDCTDCGACAAACPTSSFITTAPSQTEIVRQARQKAPAYGNIACFACARDAEEWQIDQEKVTVLPCLNYLDEYLIIGLTACGIDKVALLMQGCDDCPLAGSCSQVSRVVASTKQLLRDWQVPAKLKIFTEVPQNLTTSRKRRGRSTGAQRREAIESAGGSLMGYAAKNINELLDLEEKPLYQSPLPKQIVLKADDVEPADTYRSLRVLKMLDRVGTRPYGSVVESRFWRDVLWDPDACKRCGNCAKMCVTDAIHYEQQPAESARKQRTAPGTLTFRPSLCMGCGLCKDSCFRKAIKLSNRVLADKLDPDYTVTFFEDEAPFSTSNLIANS